MDVRDRVPGSLTKVGDCELFVREVGEGEPALFVHGLGGNSTNWTDLMWLLSDTLHGIAPDLPGFGRSGPSPTHDYTPQAQSEVMAQLIRDRFGEQPVNLFGNSMGGAICVQLAARHPELTRSVTLISPALPDRMPRLSNLHMPLMALPGLGERLATRLARLPASKRVQATYNLIYADPDKLHPQRRLEAEEEVSLVAHKPWAGKSFHFALQGIMHSYFHRGDEAPWSLAERIHVPTLLIYGQQDKLVNPRGARRASRHFPDARVMVMPNCGHVAQMEHPEQVARAWRHLIEPAVTPETDTSTPASPST